MLQVLNLLAFEAFFFLLYLVLAADSDRAIEQMMDWSRSIE